jgi:hypothetical protein
VPKKKLEPWQKKYKERISNLTNKELLDSLIEAAQDVEYYKPAEFHLDVAVDAALERMEDVQFDSGGL